jgi:starch synthase
MAVAIRLADVVNTVSPSYAREIVLPPDEASGRRGGESLETLLAARARDGALTGILNGCEYPDAPPSGTSWDRFGAVLERVLEDWIAAGSFLDVAAFLADKRVASLPASRPPVIATSVGRATEQKLALFLERLGDATALDRVLESLGEGWLILLGSGEEKYERFLQQAMARHRNFLFLKGYSDELADLLYSNGDLFLMPSLFEPCGISQMLAMRAGQPCVAHAVGGLRDTVTPENGFPFAGGTRAEQAGNLVGTVAKAAEMKLANPARWQAVAHAAASARFSWEASAERYLSEVYAFDVGARRRA